MVKKNILDIMKKSYFEKYRLVSLFWRGKLKKEIINAN